jgi:hypothetical protein
LECLHCFCFWAWVSPHLSLWWVIRAVLRFITMVHHQGSFKVYNHG